MPRPVFRGLRHYLSTLLFPLAPKNACSAETRFQGIATRSEQQARFCVRANLQCRDPFSGDCDQRWTPLLTGVREILLAVPRPVFRGLRLRGRGAQCAPRPSTCSAETRFQGIATLFLRHPQVPSHSIGLAVPRPVFRGLRLKAAMARISASTIQVLAVPRPVFRGLRQRGSPARNHQNQPFLAVPRPVFRGLRPVLLVLEVRDQERDLLAVPRPVFRGLRLRLA